MLRLGIVLAVVGALQFLVMSSWAMVYYPGGTIMDRQREGYSFFSNYFSDLGRRRAWNGQSNARSNALYIPSLIVAGSTLSVFFLLLPGLFEGPESRSLALGAALAGLLASSCYIGIALTPLDRFYSWHTLFVRAGFIAFLVMCYFYAAAIFRDRVYPNRFGNIIIGFSALLLMQILIMLFGPRSWHSPGALLLQASAQKLVVYAEMACMIILAIGAYRHASRGRADT